MSNSSKFFRWFSRSISTTNGAFGEAHPRFSWACTVSKVDIEPPNIPPAIRGGPRASLELPVPYLTKIAVTVSWTRAGGQFSEIAETLVSGKTLYVPEEEVADEG